MLDFLTGMRLGPIITSDLVYLTEVPITGAIVEVMQAGGMWTYVRTISTNIVGLQAEAGQSYLSVLPGNSTLATSPFVIGVNSNSITLDNGVRFVRLSSAEFEVAMAGGGILVDGDGIRMTPGQGGTGSQTPDYEVVVKDP